MAVTAAMVKELREKTGVGIMECKKALTEVGDDIEKAILFLRERGMSRAAKKAGRVTAEGLVKIAVSDDFKKASILEVSCETDFVSKNEDFIKFTILQGTNQAVRNRLSCWVFGYLHTDMDGFNMYTIMRSHDKTKYTPKIFLSVSYKSESHRFCGYQLQILPPGRKK